MVAKGPIAVLGGVDGLTLTYTPPPEHTGVVLISYTVTDESGAVSNVAMVRAAVNVDDITITQARYQPQNGQWTISGTCTDPFLANGTTPTEITIVITFRQPDLAAPAMILDTIPAEWEVVPGSCVTGTGCASTTACVPGSARAASPACASRAR